jgi:hypothetical protein
VATPHAYEHLGIPYNKKDKPPQLGLFDK